jgi:hypothetical protein
MIVDRHLTFTPIFIPAAVTEYHTITFMALGSMVWERSVIEGMLISMFVPAAPILAGHEFVGWLGLQDFSVVTHEQVFQAVYAPIGAVATFTITFGDVVVEWVAFGTEISSIMVLPPMREGYVFVGWEGHIEGMRATANYVFAPMFEPIASTLLQFSTFYVDGIVAFVVSVDYLDVWGMPSAPMNVGKTFVEWRIIGTRTYQAVYEVSEYSVRFVDRGVVVDTRSVLHGGKITAPTIALRPGFFLDGWRVGDDKWDFDTEITSNLELVAVWVAVSTTEIEGLVNKNVPTRGVPQELIDEYNAAREEAQRVIGLVEQGMASQEELEAAMNRLRNSIRAIEDYNDDSQFSIIEHWYIFVIVGAGLLAIYVGIHLIFLRKRKGI